MPISIHRASVPVFKRGLTIVSTLLDKGAAWATENGKAPDDLVVCRLAPDMLTLAGQVQRASDSAKFAAARLVGQDGPSFADEESTIEQLKARCAATIGYLDSVKPEAFEGSDARPVTFGGRQKMTLPGEAYLLGFAIPNFFFHVTTAYDILRHEGVPLNKMDYLGPLDAA